MELTNLNYDNFLSVLSCIFIYYTILIFLYNGFTLFCFKKQKKVLFEHEEPESEPESEPENEPENEEIIINNESEEYESESEEYEEIDPTYVYTSKKYLLRKRKRKNN